MGESFAVRIARIPRLVPHLDALGRQGVGVDPEDDERLGVVAVGIAVMATSGDSRTAAVVGLLVFLFGFEYGFVSSLTVVTEAAPGARGRAIGLSNAISTVARAASVVMSGRLFDAFGLGGSLVWVGIAASVAVVATRLLPGRLAAAGSRAPT